MESTRHSAKEKSKFTSQKTQVITWTLLFLMPIVGMAVDLVAPSLPSIARDLNVEDSLTKNMISLYILGYALGGFFSGFLSDAWGRQRLLRGNLAAFVLASLLPTLFPNISVLLCVRFLQGITIGASAVLARTILADILTTEKLEKIGASLGVMWGIGPVLGPIIGSYLQVYIGWKACFYFFAITAFIELVLVWIIVPETHLKHHPLAIKVIGNNIREILNSKLFVGIILLMGLMYTLVASFHTLCPFLIQNTLHHSTLFFGRVALVLGVIYLLASFACRYAIQKYRVEKIFFVVLNLFFVIAIGNLVLSYIFPTSVLLIIFSSACMFFLCAFIYPLAMGKGMSLFRHVAGAASALMFSNVILSSAISFCLSFVELDTIIPVLWVYFFLLASAAIIYWTLIREKKG
jgi:DHA1 family bicyclomycin/chloramphenicol resistance-like MFS transporter